MSKQISKQYTITEELFEQMRNLQKEKDEMQDYMKDRDKKFET